MHRLRLDMGVADKERGRLDARLAAKEREIGGLTNKVRRWGGNGWLYQWRCMTNEAPVQSCVL